MSWYMWVWGVASTIGAIAIVICTAAVIAETIWKRREEDYGLRAELRVANKTIQQQRTTITHLNMQLQLAREGKNEYGQISP